MKRALVALIAVIVAVGCTVEDKPDTVITPGDKPDVIVTPPNDKPDIVVTPPAGGGTTTTTG